jgi:hypothetical protein
MKTDLVESDTQHGRGDLRSQSRTSVPVGGAGSDFCDTCIKGAAAPSDDPCPG